MLLPFKLAPKLSLLPTITFVTGLNSKQNCSAKSPLSDQATPSIIDNSSNILATATNFDKNTDTNIINIDGNKFYDYLTYFLISFDPWPFQHKKPVRLTKMKITC